MARERKFPLVMSQTAVYQYTLQQIGAFGGHHVPDFHGDDLLLHAQSVGSCYPHACFYADRLQRAGKALGTDSAKARAREMTGMG